MGVGVCGCVWVWVCVGVGVCACVCVQVRTHTSVVCMCLLAACSNGIYEVVLNVCVCMIIHPRARVGQFASQHVYYSASNFNKRPNTLNCMHEAQPCSLTPPTLLCPNLYY